MVGLFRKIITISAKDSPNVLYAIDQITKGNYPPHPLLIQVEDRDGFFTQEEYNELALRWQAAKKEPCELLIVTPGVVTYPDYLRRANNWDAITREIRLFGRFYDGAEVKLYPTRWLDRAHEIARKLDNDPNLRRFAKAMGVDPAEGGDDTAWSVVDNHGLMYQHAERTPDTAEIPGRTLALMREYGLTPEQVFFDAGGGGKQIGDQLRKSGYNVQLVGFGIVKSQNPYKRVIQKTEKLDLDEDKFVYRSRRAQMYGMLREAIDPRYMTVIGADGRAERVATAKGFGIPRKYKELRRQLEPLPYLLDGEGRLYLPPKDKDKSKPESNIITLRELLGRSPDHADSLVLGVYGMKFQHRKKLLGAL